MRISGWSSDVCSSDLTKAVALQTQSLRPLPALKDDFIGLDGKIHLATGGEPPLLAAHRAAFERFARDKAGGFDGYWTHWAVDDEVRAMVARMARAEPGDVALLGNASEDRKSTRLNSSH